MTGWRDYQQFGDCRCGGSMHTNCPDQRETPEAGQASQCLEEDCTAPVRVRLYGFRDGRGYCANHRSKAYAWNRGGT